MKLDIKTRNQPLYAIVEGYTPSKPFASMTKKDIRLAIQEFDYPLLAGYVISRGDVVKEIYRRECNSDPFEFSLQTLLGPVDFLYRGFDELDKLSTAGDILDWVEKHRTHDRMPVDLTTLFICVLLEKEIPPGYEITDISSEQKARLLANRELARMTPAKRAERHDLQVRVDAMLKLGKGLSGGE